MCYFVLLFCFTDGLGVTLAKDIICSKPSTLNKALSEALKFEALEVRAIRMRERVVNEVSNHRGEANQMQNLPLSSWSLELSTMIASAPPKPAAEDVVNAVPLSGSGKQASPAKTSQWLGQGVLIMWVYISFLKELSPRKLLQGGGQLVNISCSPLGDQVLVTCISSSQPNVFLLDCKIKGVPVSAVIVCVSPI